MYRRAAIAERMHAGNYVEVVVRFACWMAGRKTSTTVHDVMAAFPVNRSTAYRWLNAWRAANGLPPFTDATRQNRNFERKC